MELIINDRRGKAKVDEGQPESSGPNQKLLDPEEGKRKWKDVAYIAMPQPISDGQRVVGMMVTGRAIGLRSDGFVCVADWAFPSHQKELIDWTKSAKTRLDTFLKCACIQSVPCISHRSLFTEWHDQDRRRLEFVNQSPVPDAIEALMIAQQKQAASKLVIP